MPQIQIEMPPWLKAKQKEMYKDVKRRLFTVSNQGCAEFFFSLGHFTEIVPIDLNKNMESYSINEFDTILLEGGTDVDPSYYGQKHGQYTDRPDFGRDSYEKAIVRYFEDRSANALGICRGSQFLTVLAGGQLIQHVTGHGRNHNITTSDGEVLEVTSTHHQMMSPGATKHVLLAWAEPCLSEVYLDGNNATNPSLLHSTMGLEPEVVWYPNKRFLAIQGHPEYLARTHEYPQYCLSLIQKYFN